MKRPAAAGGPAGGSAALASVGCSRPLLIPAQRFFQPLFKRNRRLVSEIRPRFRHLVAVYENTASLQDRTVGTGKLVPALAQQFGAGGYVGRASGREHDARKAPGYAPYDALAFTVPVLSEGDVNARVWIRIRELEQSLGLIDLGAVACVVFARARRR